MSNDKVRVAVRVRPMNRREIDLSTKCVVDMEPTQTILHHPSKSDSNETSRKVPPKTFAFDHCFLSMDEKNPKFSNQDNVFDCLGVDILERVFEGYNGCIFAYGQTGSGKSYTMMGTLDQKGLIPRLCDALFDGISKSQDVDLSFKVEVSYMEIYNERVHDLLDPKGCKQNLRVREHNILGPYVDGLSMLVVSSFEDIEKLMSEGNKARTVAATNMNSESSRSHAVFNIILTQTLVDKASSVSGEKVSKLSLVDLAGSERAQKTGAVGERLKEGSNINKSLTTLGLVISALADQSGGKNKNKFVPYRDSVLTWLLKDNLGGNSKTVMVATISPAADNYEETLSTLRYADRAKRIINHAVVNEDPNARIIRELREEVEALRKELDKAQSMKAPDLMDRLEESEKLMKEMSKTWEEKLQETERIHQERHTSLEKMGISVEMSGIKVELGKYFLVNLNADPSLNELLVYYLKEHTLVGHPDAPVQQDIQLSGLGIMPEHCIVDIDSNSEVIISPIDGARTCVNGSVIEEKTKIKHGDRILWGMNHFFRVNCPKANSPQTPDELDQTIDYDFAQQELMLKEFGNNPVNDALKAIEKQHEEEKQEALEKQRQMYERQMQMLRNQLMSPGTPSLPFPPFELSRTTPTGSGPKYQLWAQEKEKLFKTSLVKLREEVVKANALVREANFLAQEMGKATEFSVTLQIPAGNLSPNRRRGAFVSEPAILAKRKGRSNQVWSMEKLGNKIIDMRDMYEERKEKGLPIRVDDCEIFDWDQGPPMKGDPFYESQENHNLIGVANMFLNCLFYDVKLNYHVPIISQQGEVAGKLHIQISKLGGGFTDRVGDAMAEATNTDEETPTAGPIYVRVLIREARGLPPSLANFVFCQYTFWDHPEPIVIPPDVNPDTFNRYREINPGFRFNHRKDFRVQMTEEFIEHCSEGALSIEVWGHRSPGFNITGLNFELENVQAKSRSLVDRWSEVMRKLELLAEIHELTDQGEYAPVEVNTKQEVLTGGVFQLRQGHSRRIMVMVHPVQNSGTLPIICDSITSISVGSICARSKLQKGLDSYQEEDMNRLRERWSEALMRRKEYLDEQIQKLMNKQDKSDADIEREKALIDQWVCLTEERNAVLVPAAGSGIPGAPADWDPLPGMEKHTPVLFLDLNADDMSTPATEGYQAVGTASILPKEHGMKFVTLPIIKNYDKTLAAVASWDSSMHDSPLLNRVTPSNERVYLILKVIVRLSHPAAMEIMLRKRLCINVYKKQILTSMTDMLKKHMIQFSKFDYLYNCGVTYEIVSNIPKASEDLEDRETLAQMAASQNEENPSDGETYIEKYIRGVSAVESILTLDRLRQEVAVKELLTASGKSLRKTASVPNIHEMVMSPTNLTDQVLRADSIQDLSLHDSLSAIPSHYHARPNFLNLHTNFASGTKSKAGISPHASKLVTPMKTLIEEQFHREKRPLLHQDTEESLDDDEENLAQRLPKSPPGGHAGDDFQEFESYKSQHSRNPKLAETHTSEIKHSATSDSISDMQAKSCTPSMTSSGYGSQAVSTLTLSSEDSMSVKSISVDEAGNELRDGSNSSKSSPKNQSIDKTDSLEHEDSVIFAGENDGSLQHDLLNLEKLDNTGRKSRSSSTASDGAHSLLDDGVPDLSDIPLEPVQSPPPTTSCAINISCESDNKYESNFPEFTQKVLDKDRTVSTNPESEVPSNSSIVSQLDMLEIHEGNTSGSSSDESETRTDKHRSCKNKNSNSVSTCDVSRESNDAFSSSSAAQDKESEDLYSVDALEELEKLGGLDSEDHDSHLNRLDSAGSDDSVKDNRKTKLNLDLKLNKDDDGVKESHIQNIDNDPNVVEIGKEPLLKFPGSPKMDFTKQRPVSCVLPASAAAELTSASFAAAYEDLMIRSGASPSDEHLSGEDSLSTCSFGSRADLDRLHESPVPSWISVGESVLMTSSRGASHLSGIVQFVGPTEFAHGPWVGVELDMPDGKNDGAVNSIRYFKCRPRHGIFVRHDKLIWDKRRRRSSKKGSQRRSAASAANTSGSAQNLSRSMTSPGQASSPSSVKAASGSFMNPTSASSAKRK